ncbi:MAG: response regulator [Candidatus Omnitrophota bacterium]|nr:response regulator [Candidatus Omnitrophota bacterium]
MPQPTILVCDDEESVRSAVGLVLEQHYQLVFAKDGEEALKQFEAQPVDLVLLDIKMPKLGGLEVLSTLMSRQPSPRVLMLTAYHSVELAQRATQLGAIDYVSKPFERQDLLAAVERALSLRDWSRPNPQDQPRQTP